MLIAAEPSAICPASTLRELPLIIAGTVGPTPFGFSPIRILGRTTEELSTHCLALPS
jgi:hypothetical protein